MHLKPLKQLTNEKLERTKKTLLKDIWDEQKQQQKTDYNQLQAFFCVQKSHTKLLGCCWCSHSDCTIIVVLHSDADADVDAFYLTYSLICCLFLLLILSNCGIMER